MIIKCPECGHQVSDHAETCPSCGISIEGNIVKCPHCNSIMLKNQEVCPSCLMSIHQPVAQHEDTEIQHVEQTQDEPEVTPDNHHPKKHKILWKVLATSFTIALALVLVGLYFYHHTQQQNEQYAYENAMQSKEPAVLQNFLDIYQNASAEHRDSVTARLEELKKVDQEWYQAVTNNSKAAYQRYMERHPESIHNIEAKIKIDSIDWIIAAGENTVESYKQYMDHHADGSHFVDAKMNFDKLSEQQVSSDDEQMITQLFTSYFNAMAAGDEAALTATLAPVLQQFLRKPDATPQDVVTYMRRLHEDEDISGMSFLLNNDWKIDKAENIETGEMDYIVSFSANQHIDRSNPEKERKNVYKVSGRVSAAGKISELNMKKVIQ